MHLFLFWPCPFQRAVLRPCRIRSGDSSCTYTYACTHMHSNMCKSKCTQAHAHKHTKIYAHTNICTIKNTHTHTSSEQLKIHMLPYSSRERVSAATREHTGTKFAPEGRKESRRRHHLSAWFLQLWGESECRTREQIGEIWSCQDTHKKGHLNDAITVPLTPLGCT